MIVNRINNHHIDHHHIIYHQGILDNILNLMNFSTKRNCKVLYNDFEKMIIKMKGWSIEGEGGSLILTLIGEVDSLSLMEKQVS